MVSESGTRSRGRRGSRTPMSRDSRSPSPRRRQDSRSLSRSRTRSRSYSRSPSPRRNGRYRSRSRSYSRDQSWSRSRSRSRDRSDGIKSTKIVVERLTKNVTEDHLREIFGQFGPIDDLDLPMNRQFNSNRGTAYILYVDELDAEAAVANMHEGQIDGAIINVSIVLPRRKISPAPPTARRGANINPLLPPPGRRPSANGDNGPQNTRGKGGPPTRGRRHSPAGRYGPRSDTWRPRSMSRSPSRSRSPPSGPGARGGGGGGSGGFGGGSGRYRERSNSYARSPSRSRSPPPRRERDRGRRPNNGDDQYRSFSRSSHGSHRLPSRSRSPSRGHGHGRRAFR